MKWVSAGQATVMMTRIVTICPTSQMVRGAHEHTKRFDLVFDGCVQAPILMATLIFTMQAWGARLPSMALVLRWLVSGGAPSNLPMNLEFACELAQISQGECVQKATSVSGEHTSNRTDFAMAVNKKLLLDR